MAGCAAFYNGSVADKIFRSGWAESVGLPLSAEDFAAHRGEWIHENRAPLSTLTGDPCGNLAHVLSVRHDDYCAALAQSGSAGYRLLNTTYNGRYRVFELPPNPCVSVPLRCCSS
eukprot:SAG11_NODE_13_length_26388_cov_67.360341_25_plen_115_part_00